MGEGSMSNSGPKIIAMANTLTIILVILSILSGIATGVAIGNTGDGIGFTVGLITTAIGCVLAWVSHLLLAGFGELVQNTHEILNIAKGQMAQDATLISSDKNNIQNAYQEQTELQQSNPISDTEKEHIYQNIRVKLDGVKKRRDPKECKAIMSDLEQLAGYNYKDSLLILRQSFTPLIDKVMFGLVRCPICNFSQSKEHEECSKCGILFLSED
jgi:hypothetical protein